MLCPGASLTYFNELNERLGKGGEEVECPTEVHNLYPKTPNFIISLAKQILVFLHQQILLQIFHISSKFHLCYG